MELAFSSAHIFWTITRDLPFPQLCRLQRVCKQWRRRLCPKPDCPYFWNRVFCSSGDEMTLLVMKEFHREISPLPYHGLKLAETWLRREQRVSFARTSLHKVWLSERIRTRKIPSRSLSCIARALLCDEQIFECSGCKKRFFGPWLIRKTSECCNFSSYQRLSFSPHPSLLLTSHECNRCGIYGRKWVEGGNSRLCIFCNQSNK